MTKNKKLLFQSIIGVLAQEKNDIYLVIGFAVITSILSLAAPVATQALVNSIAFTGLLQPVFILALLVLVVLTVAGFIKLFQSVIVENIQQRIFSKITLDLAFRLPRVTHEVFSQTRSSELVNRFFEIFTVQKSIAFILVEGLVIFLQTVVGLFLLTLYHPFFLMLALFLFLAIYLIIKISNSIAIKTCILESKAKYQVAGWLDDIAQNPLLFKTNNGPSYSLLVANNKAQQYLTARKAHFRVLFLQNVVIVFLHVIVSAIILAVGGTLVIKKQLSLGQLVAAELVVNMILNSLGKFSKHLEAYYDLMASFDKLLDLFDLELENQNLNPIENLEELAKPLTCSINQVSFSSKIFCNHSLTNISAHFIAGEKVALVGAESSILLDLMMGLYSPSQGSIFLNEKNINDLNLESLRKQIMLLRKPEFFDGTLLENIGGGQTNLSLEAIYKALKQVNLFEAVNSLPQGIHTAITLVLSYFSNEQIQRLYIAKALVLKPKLLLIDHWLPNCSQELKSEIMKLLTDVNAPWTLLLATNSDFEISFCQRKIVLKNIISAQERDRRS